MPKIPNLNLPREAMPWGNSVEQRLSQLDSSASRREQGETNGNRSQSATIRVLQDQVANLNILFNDLVTQVNDAINANSMTTTEIQALVASPGAIAPTNVDASGRVFSAGALVSPGSHDYNVSVGYVAAWINGDGTLGTSPSTEALKKDLTPMDQPTGVLDLQPYWGHYDWDDSSERPKSFLLAEAVYQAGFGPDIAPLDETGKPFTVNYSQLVPALIAELRASNQRIAALEAAAQGS